MALSSAGSMAGSKAVTPSKFRLKWKSPPGRSVARRTGRAVGRSSRSRNACAISTSARPRSLGASFRASPVRNVRCVSSEPLRSTRRSPRPETPYRRRRPQARKRRPARWASFACASIPVYSMEGRSSRSSRRSAIVPMPEPSSSTCTVPCEARPAAASASACQTCAFNAAVIYSPLGGQVAFEGVPPRGRVRRGWRPPGGHARARRCR